MNMTEQVASSGTASDLYSGGPQFVLQPEQKLS
jgi:hypothetical protein